MVSGSDLRDLVRGTLARLASAPECPYRFYDIADLADILTKSFDVPLRSTRAALAELVLCGEVERNAAGSVRLKARLLYADGLPVAPIVHDEPGDGLPRTVACPVCGAQHDVAADASGAFDAPCGGRVYVKGLTQTEAAVVLGVERADLALKPEPLAEVVSLAERRHG